MSLTPARRAAAIISSASAMVRASGFSHTMCLPASAAATPMSRCTKLGAPMQTMSTSGRSSRRRASSYAASSPYAVGQLAGPGRVGVGDGQDARSFHALEGERVLVADEPGSDQADADLVHRLSPRSSHGAGSGQGGVGRAPRCGAARPAPRPGAARDGARPRPGAPRRGRAAPGRWRRAACQAASTSRSHSLGWLASRMCRRVWPVEMNSPPGPTSWMRSTARVSSSTGTPRTSCRISEMASLSMTICPRSHVIPDSSIPAP